MANPVNKVQTLLVFVVIAAALWWSFSRSRSLLKQWADENDYEILDSEYRIFRKGPFFWTSSRGQTVYYVKTRDKQGNMRSGWVRCGSWWWGLLADETEVRWEDES